MYVGGVAKYATTYTYTGSNLDTIVYPRGNRVDFTWDSADNLTERRHRTNNTSVNDASDIVHVWTYVSNFVTSYTDPEGNATTYTRDSSGNVTKITFPTVTNPVTQTAAEKSYTYNTFGQLTQVTDEEGKVTKYNYITTIGATQGLREKIEVDPLGLDLETTLAYDPCARLTTRTDPRGNATTYVWDNLNRLLKVTAPSPLSYETKYEYEYDANGNVTKKEVENVDEDGDSYTANPWITTTYTYSDEDELLTIVEEIDASTTRTTTFAYDVGGNRIRVTKPEGNKDKWEFDERDFVKKLIKGELATEEATFEYTYDDNGNLATSKDGRGKTTSYTYDLFDRRTKTTDPLSHYTGDTECGEFLRHS